MGRLYIYRSMKWLILMVDFPEIFGDFPFLSYLLGAQNSVVWGRELIAITYQSPWIWPWESCSEQIPHKSLKYRHVRLAGMFFSFGRRNNGETPYRFRVQNFHETNKKTTRSLPEKFILFLDDWTPYFVICRVEGHTPKIYGNFVLVCIFWSSRFFWQNPPNKNDSWEVWHSFIQAKAWHTFRKSINGINSAFKFWYWEVLKIKF